MNVAGDPYIKPSVVGDFLFVVCSEVADVATPVFSKNLQKKLNRRGKLLWFR